MSGAKLRPPKESSGQDDGHPESIPHDWFLFKRQGTDPERAHPRHFPTPLAGAIRGWGTRHISRQKQIPHVIREGRAGFRMTRVATDSSTAIRALAARARQERESALQNDDLKTTTKIKDKSRSLAPSARRGWVRDDNRAPR